MYFYSNKFNSIQFNNHGTSINNDNTFIKTLRARLQNNYYEMVKKSMNNDCRTNTKSKNKLRTYRLFKQDHKQEQYLSR